MTEPDKSPLNETFFNFMGSIPIAGTIFLIIWLVTGQQVFGYISVGSAALLLTGVVLFFFFMVMDTGPDMAEINAEIHPLGILFHFGFLLMIILVFITRL